MKAEAGKSQVPQDTRKKLGAYGEQLALSLLEEAGYRILERNWRCRLGEMDLVAADDDTVVFVEVRTRRVTGSYGTSKESVDARKQAQVRKIALAYLHAKGRHDVRVRFDVVAIELDAATSDIRRIEHLKNAF
ncbi:YraN family protein [Gorillibacterium massiliense]|uniref:YraN family protein n=1 Tax=Gorillibacterium massiliense TaxID=1280390 RepID=UPI0004BC212C|nr:YraN family protein [Gorillibacterium massiliense]